MNTSVSEGMEYTGASSITLFMDDLTLLKDAWVQSRSCCPHTGAYRGGRRCLSLHWKFAAGVFDLGLSPALCTPLFYGIATASVQTEPLAVLKHGTHPNIAAVPERSNLPQER